MMVTNKNTEGSKKVSLESYSESTIYPYDRDNDALKAFRQKIHTHPLVLFCDYDCDGLMGASSVWTLLKANGLDDKLYIYSPDRNTHGYGFTFMALDEMVTNTPCFLRCQPKANIHGDIFPLLSLEDILKIHHVEKALMVSIDLGSSASDTLLQKYMEVFDIIITDHHIPTSTLAYQYNPSLAGVYSYSGALVSYFFFKEQLGLQDCQEALELASVSLISDCIPLDSTNESYHQLLVNPKHRAIKRFLNKITWQNFHKSYGFGFVNIINSASRLSGLKGYSHSHYDAITYCLYPDHPHLFKILKNYQEKRKEITDKLKADLPFKRYRGGIVVAGGAHLPLGFLGLLASWLLERDPNTNACFVYRVCDGNLDISCRARFDLYKFLQEQKSEGLSISFGGHAKALGLRTDMDTFKSVLENLQGWIISA